MTALILLLGSIGTGITHLAAGDAGDTGDSPQTAAGEPRRETREQLTAKSFDALHKLVVAQPDEYRWDEIPWFTSIWHARKKAAAEDKPLLVFRTHGAGFNDPLGNC
jgi:hypothetical protein